MNPGLGIMIDLSAFDQLAGIERAYTPTVDVLTDAGSFWHVLLGIGAGVLPVGIGGASAVAFSGYELSKIAAGESAARVAGSLLEFATGLLLAALWGRYGR